MRWKTFKDKSGQDEDEDEESLADELDVFCKEESTAVYTLDTRYADRLGFADVRTVEMNQKSYDRFTKSRRVSLLQKGGLSFSHWLEIPTTVAKTVLDCINFIVYDWYVFI